MNIKNDHIPLGVTINLAQRRCAMEENLIIKNDELSRLQRMLKYKSSWREVIVQIGLCTLAGFVDYPDAYKLTKSLLMRLGHDIRKGS